ncbi:MAG: hypothetical protein JWM31_1244, partial [Solirubrobacterales bacterium]|nr:hypothetical protein [Solirubrobacterales bacterium]
GALLSAGYLLTAETLRDLEALEAGSAMGSVRRALLLGRGEAAPDARLVEALQATGVATDVEVGPGWTALQADPDHPASDEGTFARIARWLESGPAATVHQPPLASEVEGLRTLGPVTELATHLAGGGFAVITQPVAQTAAAGTVVFVGAGAVRHTGPNRMWVEAARRLAASGYPSARIDLPGIGEADGDHPVDARGLYSHERQRQVSRVLSDLRGLGLCGTFALVGLCSGGYTAFHAVADEPDVGGACLLNPNLLDDTVDPDEALRAHAVSGQVRAARSVRSWRRLVRGEIPLRTAAGMLKVLGRKALERPSRARGDGRAQGAGAKWASIRERGRHVTVVFASAEPLERAWAASGERERVATSPGVHIVDVPHAGHTFRPLWAQREVLHAIEASVRTILGPVP